MMPREFDVKPDFGPTEQFPDYAIPFQDPLSATERIRIARFRDHRDKVHNGPLYTVFSKKRGLEDPFEDVATYSSKRYHRQKRKVPKLDARPYVFEFFPTELWETMDASYAPGGDRSVVLNGKKEKKRLLIASLNTALPNGGLRNGDMGSDESGDEGDGDGDGDDEDPQKDKKKSVLANLMKHKDDEEEDAVSGDDADREDDDDREDGIEEEDDYQDDEEGDYNAEQYFDDGDREVDYGDDDGGGGGGAWYD
ncbi:hypothetical protein DRE_06687 [Drechslerella stenobrocha 248]|uniref:DNA-directed RNA polymerase III subunit n=1 Tax=Drechslerella stenobrocha 248 TaxID=1043628 RepID=W7I6R4_9PEZI|nr:hypothetical protein DRE_06687 [Drechslerella stenobrocha 248]